MQKFIFKTSIFSILIFLFLISVNYWGDSAKLFHTSYENKIADIIFSNQNATNISNYNDRVFQKELINKLNSKPDILVIGSSRTMLINSTYFKNEKVINNSVSGASIEDLIAIYQMFKNKNLLPKKIILGIDPWLFNEKNNQTRWQSIGNEYNAFFKKSAEIEENILNNEVKQLFSLSYFQASFRNLPNVILGISDPIGTENIYNQSNTKLVDGSISYGKKYREVSNEQIKGKAQLYISGRIYSIENYNEISPRIFNEFEKLCDEILKNDIELSFFLAPYHPIVFEKFEKDYQIVLEVENKISEFALEKNIKLLGSFNPVKIGIDNSGFYDGMHSKESTIKDILKVKTQNNSYKSIGNW
jgi:hypothetical protein